MSYATTGLYVLIAFIVFMAVILVYDLVVLLRGGVTVSQWFNWIGKASPVVPLIIGLGFGLSMGHFFWPIYQTQPQAKPLGWYEQALDQSRQEEEAEDDETDEPPLAGASCPDLYPVAAIEKIAGGHWHRPRATVEGKVTLVKHEDDGDWHFRVDAGGQFIVCEIIPELETKNGHPKLGDKVIAKGVVRYDGEPGHNWWELHPVVEWKKR